MDEIWTAAREGLELGEPTALVLVIETEGSVPGKAGAMMIVRPKLTVGTVGGGEVEHLLIDEAVALASPTVRTFAHDGESTTSICSGAQTIASLPLGEGDLRAVAAVERCLQEKRCGRLEVGPEGLRFEADEEGPTRLDRTDGGWRFSTTVGFRETLTIVGGGHVALALSRIAHTLSMRIRVLDDRPDVATMRENTYAHELRTVAYEDVAEHVPQGPTSYVVIMTHAHRGDELVLGKLAGRDYAYLGMMGSSHKIAVIYDNLERIGVARAHLESVHAPIGLPIGSRTPEEIAVSIAAQLVQVRTERRSTQNAS